MSNEFDPTQMPHMGNIKQLDDDWEEPKTQNINNPSTRAPETKATPTKPGNPLSSYFRAPGMTIKLPSQLVWYADSDIDLTISGEVEIFPMTAADELLFKNPDAIMSGRATENAIKSCVPCIIHTRSLVQADIDIIMMAIRAVTYGDDYEIQTKCPDCEAENSYQIDIRNLMSGIEPLDPPYSVQMKDLNVFVKQYDLENIFIAQQIAFQESKKIEHFKLLEDKGEDISSIKAFGDTIDRLNDVKLNLAAKSITHIIMPDGQEITNRDFINEFMVSLPARDQKVIQDKVDSVTGIKTVPTEHEVVCRKCGHKWDIPLEFNPANFL